MLKKLASGEYSLKSTFWKFVVIGMIILNLLNKIFAKILVTSLSGHGMIDFYTKYFHPVYSGKANIFWSLSYLLTLILIIVYSVVVIKGIWKASENYAKSPMLTFLAKFVTLVIVGFVLHDLRITQFIW